MLITRIYVRPRFAFPFSVVIFVMDGLGKTFGRNGWKHFLSLLQAFSIYSSVFAQQRAPYRQTPEWGAPQDRLSGFAKDSLGETPPGKGMPMSCYDRLVRPDPRD